MSFFWFGDSWVAGDELGNELRELDIHKHTFAYLVSKHFDEAYYNYSENASSIPHLIVQLNNARPYITEGDVLLFGLTGPDRTFVVDEENKLHHLYMTHACNDTRINQELNKAWYKYVDSVPYRNVVNCNILDLIKSHCNELNVKCLFYNLFTTTLFTDAKLVSENDWLIKQTDCISSEIMHVFDNEHCTVISSNQPQLTDVQWTEHDKLLEKYFRPNYVHPNVLGHSTISNRIIKRLDEITK